MRNHRWLFLLIVFLSFNILTGTATAAPSAINTLQADGVGNNQIRLTFMVPNPTVGKTLTAYEVRYKSISFSALSWASATLATGAAAPGTPGTQQIMTVTLPTATMGALYYIAIKTRDSGGTTSLISNVASTRTLDGQFVTVSWNMVNAYTDGSYLNPNSVGYVVWWGHVAGGPYPYSQDVLEPEGSAILWLDYDSRPFYFSAQAYVIANPSEASGYADCVVWNWTWH